jgi:hypothetical protein
LEIGWARRRNGGRPSTAGRSLRHVPPGLVDPTVPSRLRPSAERMGAVRRSASRGADLRGCGGDVAVTTAAAAAEVAAGGWMDGERVAPARHEGSQERRRRVSGLGEVGSPAGGSILRGWEGGTAEPWSGHAPPQTRHDLSGSGIRHREMPEAARPNLPRELCTPCQSRTRSARIGWARRRNGGRFWAVVSSVATRPCGCNAGVHAEADARVGRRRTRVRGNPRLGPNKILKRATLSP